MVTSNDPTLVASSKPCQSAQTSKTSEHAQCMYVLKGSITRNPWPGDDYECSMNSS